MIRYFYQGQNTHLHHFIHLLWIFISFNRNCLILLAEKEQLVPFFKVFAIKNFLSTGAVSPLLGRLFLAYIKVFSQSTLVYLNLNTLLIKSADSKLHPPGISCFLIWTLLAKI